MVQFLSINFFSWISSIFVGFFKSSHFFVSPCINIIQEYITTHECYKLLQDFVHHPVFDKYNTMLQIFRLFLSSGNKLGKCLLRLSCSQFWAETANGSSQNAKTSRYASPSPPEPPPTLLIEQKYPVSEMQCLLCSTSGQLHRHSPEIK